MTKSRSVGLVFGVLLGLALVACSAPGPATPGGPSSSGSVAQQGIDNKVITIGLATVMSGPSASASQIAEGAKVYLDMVNRTGGVNG